jgi:hypothetical protein
LMTTINNCTHRFKWCINNRRQNLFDIIHEMRSAWFWDRPSTCPCSVANSGVYTVVLLLNNLRQIGYIQTAITNRLGSSYLFFDNSVIVCFLILSRDEITPNSADIYDFPTALTETVSSEEIRDEIIPLTRTSSRTYDRSYGDSPYSTTIRTKEKSSIAPPSSSSSLFGHVIRRFSEGISKSNPEEFKYNSSQAVGCFRFNQSCCI